MLSRKVNALLILKIIKCSCYVGKRMRKKKSLTNSRREYVILMCSHFQFPELCFVFYVAKLCGYAFLFAFNEPTHLRTFLLLGTPSYNGIPPFQTNQSTVS